MRILLLTQIFQPEPNYLKGIQFAQALQRDGHQVEVLTHFPHIPIGRVYDGYNISPWMIESIDGVRVIRLMSYISHDASAFRRTLSYLTFALSASILGPFLVSRPEVVHVYQGPGTLALPAMLLRLIYRTPWVLDIQDLWPESVSSTGMLKSKVLLRILGWWSSMTYRLATAVVVLSNGYRKEISSRGCKPSKIHVVHNWSSETGLDEAPLDESSLRDFGLLGRFNVTYAGTLGRAQGLDSILSAAAIVQNELPQVQFVLVGDGVELPHLKALAVRLNLRNVLFIGRQTPELINRFLKSSDVLLLHLKDNPLGRIAIPQKTQAYLAVGKAILMCTEGDAADLVREANAGIICRPDHPDSIAEGVMTVARMSKAALEELGANGRRFYFERLSFSHGFSQMNSILTEAAARRS